MAVFNKFSCFTEDLAEKVHNLGSDQLVIALCNTANAPVAGNSILSNLTTIAYTNMTTRNITTSTSAQTAGVYKLVLTDLTITQSVAPSAAFQYAVIYNDTSTSDSLIGWYDYGSAITLGIGESLLIDFDGSAGVLTIT